MISNRQVHDKIENVHYWMNDGRIYFQLPDKKGKGYGGFPKEFGPVKDKTLYIKRTSIHTYIHKTADKAPGEESISFSMVLMQSHKHWGFDFLDLNIKTKKHGTVKGVISMEDWNKLANERKHPSGYFELQSDVLVKDLLKILK